MQLIFSNDISISIPIYLGVFVFTLKLGAPENLKVCRRYVTRYCSPGSDITYHRAGGVSAVVVL